MGYSLIGLVAFEAVLIGTVLSLVCHFNSKKRRWSIDKGRRVMPLPQHLLPQEAVVADKPNDKPNDKPTAENPLHLDI